MRWQKETDEAITQKANPPAKIKGAAKFNWDFSVKEGRKSTKHMFAAKTTKHKNFNCASGE
jgi:hypothetical protein